MKNQGTLENQANFVYLSIGSNLGNKKNNINFAKYLMLEKNIDIIKSSSFFESKSWPNKKFPKYLNIALYAKTYLKLNQIFEIIKDIETKMGRKKTKKNYPRICDIDIIDFNGEVSINYYKKFNLEIPHPRMHIRNFVLLPLYEIEKKWNHPKFKKNIVNLISNLDESDIRAIKQV